MARELTLRLTVGAGCVEGVDVVMPPLDTAALLRGKTAEDALAILPAVLSVCAQAQSAAAAAALWAAGKTSKAHEPEKQAGAVLPEALQRGYALAVWVESLQESLRSLCLGLPETLRMPALMMDFGVAWRRSVTLLQHLQPLLQKEWLRQWHEAALSEAASFSSLSGDFGSAMPSLTEEARAVVAVWEDFCVAHVHGEATAGWQGRGGVAANKATAATPVLRWYAQMTDEVPALGRSVTAPLPTDFEQLMQDDECWDAMIDTPYDASAWRRVQSDNRMQPVIAWLGNSVAARLWARLVDVAQTIEALRGLLENGNGPGKNAQRWPLKTCAVKQPGPALTTGCAGVECARGLLVHRVTMKEGRVAAYSIQAPTAWNFHRDGALGALVGWPVEAEAQLPDERLPEQQLRRHATWLVQMLDPCVAFNIEVHRA